jgi:hypothetical protein
MNGKDDKRRGKPTPPSSSQELFEKIFNQANMEIKREKAGNQQYTPAPAPGRWQQQHKLLDAEKRVVKQSAPVPGKPEKAKASLPGKAVKAQTSPKSTAERVGSNPPAKIIPKTDKRNVKRSSALMAAVLLIVLAILAGIISNYMGIVDIRLLLDNFKFDHEREVAQASVPRKRAVKPPEKAISSPKQPQEREQNPAKNKDEPKAPSSAPTESSSLGGVKEDKLAELETPTTVAQATSGVERVEEKVPSASTGERPNAPEVAAKQESEPSPVQSEVSAKAGAPEVAPSQLSTPKYPYSVYLGSFKAAKAVNKAISEYQEKGLSAYWTKVDLGDKGVWFRFFVGHFQTKEEAEKFIRDRNIQGATPGITRYANLIGIYGSDKEVEDQRRALVSAGFYPYVIKGADGKRLLYSGAFDRNEYAEKERTILASKGIKSEISER